MNFLEGVEYDYGITAKVPAPGKVWLLAEHLPEGAAVVSLSQSLLWNPPAGSAVDPANPNQAYRDYEANIILQSDAHPGVELKKPVTLRVYARRNNE